LENLVTSLQITFLDNQDTLLEFETLNGEEILTHVIDVVRRSGGEIRAMRCEAVPLEEVFAHLTREPEVARQAETFL